MFEKILDPIYLSRIIILGSQLLCIFLVEVFQSPEKANTFYQLLAWGSIISAISAFGASGVLAKLVAERGSYIILPLLTYSFVFKAIMILASIYILVHFGFVASIDFWVVFIISFCLSMNFIDFIYEGKGEQAIIKFSVLKIFVFLAFLLIKVFLVIYSFQWFERIIHIEWFVLCLIALIGSILEKNVLKSMRSFRVKEYASFLTNTSWVWISTIIRLSWSRGLFIFLSKTLDASTSNTYFIIIRALEAASFIPKSLSSVYFSKLLYCDNSKDRMMIKEKYLKQLGLVSIVLSVLTVIFAVIYVSLHNQSLSLVTLFLLLVSSLLFYFRFSVSREIIYQDCLHYSFISYLVGAFFGILICAYLGEMLNLQGAFFVYFIYTFLSFFVPIFFERKRYFNEFIDACFKVCTSKN